MFDNFSVYLRALEPEDYIYTVKWHNDQLIYDTVVNNFRYVSSEYEKRWIIDRINSQDIITLAVCYKENNDMIGLVTLSKIDRINRTATFGTMIGNRNYWGLGLATEATILMLNYGFNSVGLERIEARQLITNLASIKVKQKCGFVTEGVLRKAFVKNGEQVDLNLMSVIKQDFIDLVKSKL